jgi:hypothetical protein
MSSRCESFRVTVHYREPTYEMVNGPKRDPYRWVTTLVADDRSMAERLALEEFEAMARLSSVGWVRRVVQVATESLGVAVIDIAI